MSSAEKIRPLENAKGPWWRSSLYEEPVWVSVAWILGPVAAAALALFYLVR